MMHLSRKLFVRELQQRHSANKQRGRQVAAEIDGVLSATHG
jgi:hypothetical protein